MPHLTALWAAQANSELADLLVDMHLRRTLSAKHFCTIAFWCKQASLAGAVAQLGLNPRANTGHFQRKLDQTLGFQEEVRQVRYDLDVPGHCKYQVEREVRVFPVIPPHEAIFRKVAENPSLLEELRTVVRDGVLPDD